MNAGPTSSDLSDAAERTATGSGSAVHSGVDGFISHVGDPIVARTFRETAWNEDVWMNPFSTRFVGPGNLRFRWNDQELAHGAGVQSMIGRLRHDRHSRFALVGPHGSGKSTLLRQLVGLELDARTPDTLNQVAALRSSPLGRVVWVGTRTCRRANLKIWMPDSVSISNASGDEVCAANHANPCWFIVDGWAERSMAQKAFLFGRSCRGNIRLLVTCHRPLFGFRRLREHRFDEGIVRTLFEDLVRHQPLPMRCELRQCMEHWLSAGQWDVRQLWFELYDEAFRIHDALQASTTLGRSAMNTVNTP